MKGGGKRKSDAIHGNGVAVVVGVHHHQPIAAPNQTPQQQLAKGDDQVTLVNLNLLQPQPPKLADGFFEIEAIRRKRMRKGQVQYFIKWRGWPETANTWEPLDNLQSVSDLIDAFEHCLTSGKQRRRKRKHVIHHALPKKRLQRSTTSYSLRRFLTATTDNHPPQPAPLDDIPLSKPPAHPQPVDFAGEGPTNGDATSLGGAQQPNENGFANASNQIVEKNEENGYDPKLSELRAITNNGVDAANTSTGNGHLDGDSKVDIVDPIQSDRCRGAKRRKSGPVKRFKCPSEPVDTQKAIDTSFRIDEPGRTGPPGDAGNNSHYMMGYAAKIVKIVKAVGCSASFSGNTRDVLVTFIAKRSDDTEILVDNKYLKQHYPLMLIDFYEQRLRYTGRV